MKNAIIIFQKNPEPGKVKTRLAATVGNANALKIYNILVEHTHTVVDQISAKKYLFFSNFIENEPKWRNYSVKVQKGDDLGLRMLNAVRTPAMRIVSINTFATTGLPVNQAMNGCLRMGSSESLMARSLRVSAVK